MYRSSLDLSSKQSIPMLVQFEYLWTNTINYQIISLFFSSSWKMNRKKLNSIQTWLYESNVQNFINLAIVSGNVKYTFRCILYTCDINRNQIFRHLLPSDGTSTAGRYMENLRPQPEYTIEIEICHNKMKTTITWFYI